MDVRAIGKPKSPELYEITREGSDGVMGLLANRFYGGGLVVHVRFGPEQRTQLGHRAMPELCQRATLSPLEGLIERNADFKLSTPDNMARQPQSIVGHNQIESRGDFST